MNDYRLLSIGVLAAALLSAGCPGNTNPIPESSPNPTPTLVGISPETLSVARQLQLELPGAKVHFSAQHGGITKVESRGLDLATDPVDGTPGATPEPLVDARGTDDSALDSSTMEFFVRFGNAYGLTNPQEQLRVLVDPVNDQLHTSKTENVAFEIRGLEKAKHRTYVQTHNGLRIVGRFAHASFDTNGGLQTVNTRLLAISPNFDTTPKFSGETAWSEATSKFAEIAKSNDSLAWLGNIQGSSEYLQHVQELVITPVDSRGAVDSLAADATPHLAYRLQVRRMGTQALLYIDAKTGEVLASVDTMPSDWYDTGTTQVVSAKDELGNNQIIMTTLDGSTKYMSISPNTGSSSPAWLDENNGVSFSNTAGRADLTLTYYAPITINATKADGSQNTWLTDTTFNTGNTRQVSAFNRNMIDIWDFWLGQHSWRSWDGQGSTLWASINNHKSSNPAPQLNAWGGNGVMQIADGTTSTGQYCGASHEIVGHEMGHNVLGATAPLDYLNQSGAINEAIADFWGLAITANRGADDWANTLIGDDVGWNLRDMMTPTTYGQPDKFSNYVVTANDSGGVHTNSGIINKAHALIVRGGTFNGITVKKAGLDKLERVLFSGMLLKMWPQAASMEEFANAMLDTCKIADFVNTLFGDTSWHKVCPEFRKAYRAVEVIPTTLADIIADFHIIKDGLITAKLGNIGKKDYAAIAKNSSATANLGNGKSVGVKITDFINENGSPDLKPGEEGKLKLELPSDLTKGNYNRFISEIEVKLPNLNPSDWSKFPLELGADYVPELVTYTSQATTSAMYSLTTTVEDWGTQGFPAGISTVLLTRNTGMGGLKVYNQSESSLGAATDASSVTVPEKGIFTQTKFPTITIPTAVEVPGHPGRFQAWWDVNGSWSFIKEQPQLYALADAKDMIDETSETNNLVCVNCRAPNQKEGDTRGVIVRLQKTVPVAQMFPAEYSAAAEKLKSPYDVIFSVKTHAQPALPYRVPGPMENGTVKFKR